MTYRIIEQLCLGKNADASLCEDVIHTSPHFIAVIDGATSKTAAVINGISGGRAIATAIDAALGMASPDINYEAMFKHINHHIYDIILSPNPEIMRGGVERPTANAVIFSVHRNELWFVGDCQALDGENHYSFPKIIDEVNSAYRAAFLHHEILSGKSREELLAHDVGREQIIPMLLRQNIFANNLAAGEYAFPVINGDDAVLNFVKVIPVQNKELILASDSYPKLCSTLAESEAFLAQMIEQDPLCIGINKGTKGLSGNNLSFDDRAYIRLSFK